MIARLGKDFPVQGPGGTEGVRFSTGTNFARMRRAHTLVELAVALAIVSVVASIGWGVLDDRIATQRMLGVARMMSGDLAMLRTTAIDHDRETRIVFIEADHDLDPEDAQHGAWRLQVGNKATGSDEWDTLPADVGGVVDESEGVRSLEVGGENEAKGISLADWTNLDDDAIVFTPRGWVGNPSDNFTNGYITLQVVNKRTLGGTGEQRATLRIARSGLVRVEVSEATALPSTTVGAAPVSAR